MKLVVAIVQKDDVRALTRALRAQRFPFTHTSSTGGFLRKGNATFAMGIRDEQVEPLLQVLKENCKARTQKVSPMVDASSPVSGAAFFSEPMEVRIGGATVFVLDYERFERF